jgi:hypothetical protein
VVCAAAVVEVAAAVVAVCAEVAVEVAAAVVAVCAAAVEVEAGAAEGCAGEEAAAALAEWAEV